MAKKKRPPILLRPGKGRKYDMGAMRAVFKADGAETGRRYSISEWWLEPNTPGPGAHSHEGEDDVFYVIEGTAHFLIGRRWINAPRGSFVCAPAGVTHDFANRTKKKVGILNFSIPGGFEDHMPAIVKWFKANR
ncbi:MAG: cupin domain-containing protein [Alphaproteobacteria bacterium]|nr:cupin domain-containing protein [Alphaproteobacteria bacterium]